MVALTYLASHSEQIQFGAMVSPLSVRDPVLLARQALALDALSGGRMIMGVGAGWNAAEHAMFGYALGDVPTRMVRFEEGLEVITRLLRIAEPTSYAGRFFQLHEALLLPRSPRPHGPPIMIGGTGPRRTLPLVARYANRWDAGFLTPDGYHERAAHLDALLQQAGRKPGDLIRSVTVPVFCGNSDAELQQRLQAFRRWGSFAHTPLPQLLEQAHAGLAACIGTPDQVAAQLRRYIDVGIDELVVQWFDADDMEGLQIVAEQVLPQLN
jgi:alkanesulfonate monooxygenase SsuD/methylene tetrahydromethanopterin reductase-like flavin-dependent oxidoreductase (luciferase family)